MKTEVQKRLRYEKRRTKETYTRENRRVDVKKEVHKEA